MSNASDFRQAVDITNTGENLMLSFANLFGRSMGVAERAAEQIVAAWIKRGDEARLNKAITSILGASRDKNDLLVFTQVPKEAAETFSTLYQRDLERPAMIADFLKEDTVADGIGDLSGTLESITGAEDLMKLNNPAFVSLQSETEKIMAIRSETFARLGISPEIDRAYTKAYADKLTDNPMQEIRGLDLAEYEALKRDVQKLPQDMRFTLFPEYKVNKEGKTTVNVGFLTKTGGINAKTSYNIADIVKNILVKEKVIENSEYGDNFYEKLEAEANRRDEIIQEFVKDRNADEKPVIREIYELDAPDNVKTELEDYVRENWYSKENYEIKTEIEKKLRGTDINYNELLHVLDNDMEKSYIMKADIFIDEKTGKAKLKFDRENYAVVGKSVTIRESGNKDITIGDGAEDRSNAAVKAEHESQELDAAMQRWEKSEESTVVRLSSKEFKSIMNGSAMRDADELSYYVSHDIPPILSGEAMNFIDDASTVSRFANIELREELKRDEEIDRAEVFAEDGLYEKTNTDGLKDMFIEQSEYADSLRTVQITQELENNKERNRKKNKDKVEPHFAGKDKDEEPTI